MPVEQGELSWNANIIADFREHGGQITQGRLCRLEHAPAHDDRRQERHRSNGPARLQPRRRYLRRRRLEQRQDRPSPVAGQHRRQPEGHRRGGHREVRGHGHDHDGAERDRLWKVHTTAIPFFLEYEKKVERQLQVVAIAR